MRDTAISAVAIVVAVIAFAGCVQYRITCTPAVKDIGATQIQTKYRYRIESIHSRQDTNWQYLPKPLQVGLLRKAAQSMFPQIFADDGVPVRLHGHTRHLVNGHAARLILFAFSIGLIPGYISGDAKWDFKIEIGESSITWATLHGTDNWDEVFSWLPISWIMPMEKGNSTASNRSFDINEKTVSDATEAYFKTDAVRYGAIAHGLAVKLKELEDSGQADAAIAYRRPVAPSMIEKQIEKVMAKAKRYTVVRCRRESAEQFTYSFAVRLESGGQDALKSFRDVQREFREEIKADYLETFHDANGDSLHVDFHDYDLEGGMIVGRAEVLAITPVKCEYNSETGRGMLAVRFNPKQYATAREWIRKNIEILARDKNIAIETGHLPPAAKYYSLNEKTDGDVMEIEFETE